MVQLHMISAQNKGDVCWSNIH